jgi:hypothetical protein
MSAGRLGKEQRAFRRALALFFVFFRKFKV